MIVLADILDVGIVQVLLGLKLMAGHGVGFTRLEAEDQIIDLVLALFIA